MKDSFCFTSESVAQGHPDKLADQISDAIVDAHLAQDPQARCAVETLITQGAVVLAGEITSSALCDYEAIVRRTCQEVGYTSDKLGFDYRSAKITLFFKPQSEDIANAINPQQNRASLQGAGDQGIMFGYATCETPEYMPLPIMLAHRIVERLRLARTSQVMPFLGPDAKVQVTVRYLPDFHPLRIETIVLSTQHLPEVTRQDLQEALIPLLLEILPSALIDSNSKFLINPGGRFVIGGPASDTGLTGRKQQVDSYGGMARHGGAAFSGKDPSKIDRSASYMARYIAKNIVAAGLAQRLEVQLAYAIGIPHPVGLEVNTFGSAIVAKEALLHIIPRVFDLSAQGIISSLELARPIYIKTAYGGHFGRCDPDFTWERIDKTIELQHLS
jgi:S-adenosylmethionine synthetase